MTENIFFLIEIILGESILKCFHNPIYISLKLVSSCGTGFPLLYIHLCKQKNTMKMVQSALALPTYTCKNRDKKQQKSVLVNPSRPYKVPFNSSESFLERHNFFSHNSTNNLHQELHQEFSIWNSTCNFHSIQPLIYSHMLQFLCFSRAVGYCKLSRSIISDSGR